MLGLPASGESRTRIPGLQARLVLQPNITLAHLMPGDTLRIAVEGCGHGALVSIYEAVERQCEQRGWDGVDCVIIGGDFQAVRNASDLHAMSVPIKYREIGDFHLYYSGQLVAPYLTIFASGNHEASNHLWELYYGGWVAPNIYYLGAANIVRLGPLRIASMSGIWKGYDYRKPHYERLPYNRTDVGSSYHIREVDVRKLLQIRTQVDVGLSHDWPQGIEWKGDFKWLFREKDLFEADARSGRLGSVAAAQVLNWLRPLRWFSAHLHIRYEAKIDWKEGREDKESVLGKEQLSGDMDQQAEKIQAAHNDAEIDLDLDEASPVIARNGNEMELDMEDRIPIQQEKSQDQIKPKPAQPAVLPPAPAVKVQNEVLRAQLPASFQRQERKPALTEPVETPPDIVNTSTSFLALDKCLPKRRFLEMVEIQAISEEINSAGGRPFRFSYDPEWLAITKALASELVLAPKNSTVEPTSLQTPLARSRDEYALEIAKAKLWINLNIDDLTIPTNFEQTAPVYDGNPHTNETPREYNNPQTATFCGMLDIENKFFASEEEWQTRAALGPPPEQDRFGGRGRGRGRGHGGRGGRGSGRGRGRG